MEIKLIKDYSFNQNTYVLVENSKAIVIDPGYNAQKITSYIQDNHLTLVGVLLTHFHFDHVASTDYLCETYGVKAYIHESDKAFVTTDTLATLMGFEAVKVNPLNIISFNKEELLIDVFTFRAINLPGHSEGSSLFFINDFVFTGDTLFVDSIGRTDFPGSDKQKMIKSLLWIKNNISSETTVYPGHGDSAKFSNVKEHNLFMK